MPAAKYKTREFHGMSKTSTYYVWYNMRNRCMNPANHAFKHYGGRGITLAPEWGQFANFLADMGEKPQGMTLDRRDNNKGYSKDNCRWVTPKTQANNIRSNRHITHGGITRTLAEWSDATGIHPATISDRIDKSGWSVKDALETPSGAGLRRLTFNGETLTLTEWAKRLGMSQPRLSARLMRGWSIERALTEPLHNLGMRAVRGV